MIETIVAETDVANLNNAVVRTRQFKTTPRNTPKYSHGSLGHCEAAIKEVEKQIRATLFQMYADYNCNSAKFPAELPSFSWLVRHAAWTLTRCAVKADGQTSFFKLMSDYHGEVAKSPSWFGFVFLPSSPNWQNSGKKLTGLESQNDLMNKGSRSEVRLVQAERFGDNHVTNSGMWRVSKLCW